MKANERSKPKPYLLMEMYFQVPFSLSSGGKKKKVPRPHGSVTIQHIEQILSPSKPEVFLLECRQGIDDMQSSMVCCCITLIIKCKNESSK